MSLAADPGAPRPLRHAFPPLPAAHDGAGAESETPSTRTDDGTFSHWLRTMLPWITPAAADPVEAMIRSHRAIHARSDGAVLREAYEVAERAHRGQLRKSGEPYITHPLAVAHILADLGLDTTTLVAALLHDTVEDTSYTLRALHADFGPQVALLVDGVTKFDKVFYGAAAEAETIRKMILAAGRDVRVLIIKLADRLHNMRTLDARSGPSQERIARATRDVLIPLADRLGMQVVKRELEDIVLYTLDPAGFAKVFHHVHDRPDHGYLTRVISSVRGALKGARVHAMVNPRPRHYASIYADTLAKGGTDPGTPPRLVIAVGGPDTDCYAALGAVHGLWRPIAGRFKDFIASPKFNLYQSLHTTVLGPEDRPVEVLIRTEEMHRTAEYGIVAEFRYPHARDPEMAPPDRLEWLRRLLDWQTEAVDPVDFLDSLRCDLAEHQINVFNRDGEPVTLPAGATPVDMAYTLDTYRGGRTVAAAVNGRLVPLSAALAEGDVVEIIEADEDINAGPSREWLEFAKTAHARLQIGQWFAERPEMADGETVAALSHKIRLGRAAIGLALRQHDRALATDEPLLDLAHHRGYRDLDALLVAIAERKVDAEALVAELIDQVDRPARRLGR